MGGRGCSLCFDCWMPITVVLDISGIRFEFITYFYIVDDQRNVIQCPRSPRIQPAVGRTNKSPRAMSNVFGGSIYNASPGNTNTRTTPSSGIVVA